MTATSEPAWTPLAGGVVPDELHRLATRCLAADGGLPLAADRAFLRRRWSAPGGVAFALRAPGDFGGLGAPPGPGGPSGSAGPLDGGGEPLLAAGAVCPAADGVIVTGMVDPAARGRGLGSRLLDHALAVAVELAAAAAGSASEAAGPVAVDQPPDAAERLRAAGGVATAPGVLPPVGGERVITVETEGLTEAAGTLFASRGLRQVFAEDVMRIDPAAAGRAEWPGGTEIVEWSDESALRFHAAYAASFRERPGFPDAPAAAWIAENEDDDDFRPRWSVVASVPGVGDAGFITAAEGWIVQVGVVPQARGRGLGASLVREALTRMAADGNPEAWLNVNVNNPAAATLYRRLGFTTMGRRARYRR